MPILPSRLILWVTQSGEVIPADTVIVNIGEQPDLSFLPADIPLTRGYLKPDDHYRLKDNLFTAGDTIAPGRLVDAIGSGREAAQAVDAYLTGQEYQGPEKTLVPADRLSTAYFKKCHRHDIPAAKDDHTRCISCGTCRDCSMCYKSCPELAIDRVAKPDGGFEYVADPEKCIGCGICAGICPCGVWTMYPNGEPINMYKEL